MTQRIFDTHLHIIDPAHPLVENNGFIPAPFTVADYRARTEGLGIAGGAVVSGSFQAFDQGYLIDALQSLGPTFVGVTQIPATTTDTEISSCTERVCARCASTWRAADRLTSTIWNGSLAASTTSIQ